MKNRIEKKDIIIKINNNPKVNTIIQPKETYLDNYYSKDFLKQYFA